MVDAWVKLAQGSPAVLSDTHPVPIGTAAGEGTGVAASRHDHIHILGEGCVNDPLMLADNVVGSEHIEALSAALDCGQQQLQNVVLHKAASDPGTPAVGQCYYNTAENQIYLRVAVP